jgi:hypothetical protein
MCAERDALQERINTLEAELGVSSSSNDWRDKDFYLTYYATTGFFLGVVGAIASLLFNVVGASLNNLPPLKLIQVYLTFGLGEKALDPNVDKSLALMVGCCLYIATGMVLGVPFNLIMAKLAHKADVVVRLFWATVLGLILWILNFYVLIAWLQPLMFGGNWIVQEIPPYVGAGTHLVFAWTMALLYPLGVYAPYRANQETA